MKKLSHYLEMVGKTKLPKAKSPKEIVTSEKMNAAYIKRLNEEKSELQKLGNLSAIKKELKKIDDDFWGKLTPRTDNWIEIQNNFIKELNVTK